jgi:SpoVK/Ycf46/Vps4 family AAA+-type ATPase
MAEQRALWTRALPDLPAAEATALAAQTWLAEADIAGIAATSRGTETAALLAARMAVAPPRAARLATLTMPDLPWERLVLEPETEAKLLDVVGRVRHRATVREDWAMAHGGASLVALLSGEPGTGKTLAAEAIATRLGLPLLSADLSRIVSKYIGETEKNLSELFAAAEGFAAVLFFDEADSLFGRRTAVQDAQDRYANIEVNYLLQRLEGFDGIALLATNLAQGMDEAFLRRFDLMVPIPRPGPAQRLALWRAHLPAGRLDPRLDLGALALGFEVTGGEIRNAALSAAFAAAEAGTPIGAALLRDALGREFAKQGRPFPAGARLSDGGFA